MNTGPDAATTDAQRTPTVHGVLLEVFRSGVLITGDSGVGKSELALELVTRGHRLIADDAVQIEARDGTLIGSCPQSLQDFLEVRGVGVINVRATYGERAVSPARSIDLIVHLALMESPEIARLDRIRGQVDEQVLRGVTVPEVTIPVVVGRDLAVLVEAVVRKHELRGEGYDTEVDFLRRHKRFMQHSPS